MQEQNTVKLLGYYGGDETHAMSAWVSTGKSDLDVVESSGGKPRRARIPKLLEQLAQSDPEHGTPFEKSALHFHVRCDRATHIHIIKHRIAVAVNAESARYKELNEDGWLYPVGWPTEEDARDLNASSTQRAVAESIRQRYFGLMDASAKGYHDLIELVTSWMAERALSQSLDVPEDIQRACRKRAKESARFVLPMASMLSQDVMFNFRSFVHFQRLRNHPAAQLEVREVAAEMMRLTRAIPGDPFQHSCAAFKL